MSGLLLPLDASSDIKSGFLKDSQFELTVLLHMPWLPNQGTSVKEAGDLNHLVLQDREPLIVPRRHTPLGSVDAQMRGRQAMARTLCACAHDLDVRGVRTPWHRLAIDFVGQLVATALPPPSRRHLHYLRVLLGVERLTNPASPARCPLAGRCRRCASSGSLLFLGVPRRQHPDEMIDDPRMQASNLFRQALPTKRRDHCVIRCEDSVPQKQLLGHLVLDGHLEPKRQEQ
mmetsp:Transcript_100268/g.289497  ORF Transcript_100268/g.289497 Transcript_100268/m.289497 type:complete len:230 (-) Transcript_100268:438-1127(-)